MNTRFKRLSDECNTVLAGVCAGYARPKILGYIKRCRMMLLGIVSLNLFAFQPVALAVTPNYEYRFDEIIWNGTAGEIADYIGGNNATLVGSASNSSTGYICRSGSFTANTVATTIDAVSTPYVPGTQGSIDFWYNSNVAWNTPLSDATLLDATTDSTKPFVLSKNALGNLVFRYRDTLAISPILVSTLLGYTFAANTWHHIAVTWNTSSSILAINAFNIYIDGSPVALTLSLSINLSGIQPPGTLYIGDNRVNTSINGITVNGANGFIDEIKIYNTAINAAQVAADKAATHTCPNYIDHIQVEHDGNGLTCSPETVTVKACTNASCSSLYTGVGITGNVTWSGVASGSAAFSIPGGSGQTTVSVPVTTAGVVTYGTSNTSPTTNGPTTCLNTSTAAASCNMTFADAGFYFNVPNHVSETSQSFNVSAVKKSDNSLGCTPGFASTSKSVTFTCSYINPSAGTLPVRVAGNALNTLNSTALSCDGTGRAVTLNFNASGIATTSLQYADVGNMTLNASYSASGLSMTGTDTFITVPSSFAFSNVTAAPIKAGNNFSATITAKNAASATTLNYGRESTPEGVSLAFTKCQPTGSAAVAGSFSGSAGAFTNGVAAASNLNWSEVGNGDLSATVASGNYLSSGLTATGNTGTSGSLCNSAGNVGRFIPDHFNTVVTQGCSTGGFTYSAQPFTLQVRALNLGGVLTQNYDGSANTTPNFAKAVTLSDANASGVGVLSPTSVAASLFSAGVANATPKYTFNSAQTVPTTIKLRAIDTDNTSSASGAEGTATIRSGRLALTSVYGSELLDLPVPLEAQYWNGTSYARNQLDSCSVIPLSSIAMGNYMNNLAACETQLQYSSGGSTLVNGAARFLKLTKPGAGNNGSTDLSINLASAVGNTCLSASQSAATNASLPWFGSNPTARATFGIYKTPIIYLREDF